MTPEYNHLYWLIMRLVCVVIEFAYALSDIWLSEFVFWRIVEDR